MSLRFLGLCLALAASVLAANLRLVDSGRGQGARGVERGEGKRPDSPLEWARWRQSFQRDENGNVDPDGLLRGKAQMDAMRAMQADGVAIAGISPTSWTSLGPGNIGGRIRAMVFDPDDANTIYIGSASGGIWKTTNAGTSWAPVNDFMSNLAVTSIVVDSTSPVGTRVYYAATGEGFFNTDGLRGAGIFKSTDNGVTWTQLPSTNNSNFHFVNKMAISATGNLLAATRTGVFRSSDGGATFPSTTGIGTGPSDLGSGMTDVEFDPVTPTRAVASGFGGSAWLSLNSGASWTKAAGLPGSSNGFTRVELGIAPSATAAIYASVDRAGGSLYLSLNGGVSYSIVFDGNFDSIDPLGGQGWYDNMVFVWPTDPNRMIWGGIDLWRTPDGGSTFFKMSAWDEMVISGPTTASTSAHADHHIAVAHPGFNGTSNRTVFFGNDGGVYKTQDLAAVVCNPFPGDCRTGWSELNNGLAITQFFGAAGHAGTGRIAGGTQDNGSPFYNPASSSPSENWTDPIGGDGGWSAYDPTDPNVFYGEYTFLQIYRNTTGGASRSVQIGTRASGLADAGEGVQPGLAEFIAPFVLDPSNPNIILAGGQSLWRSSNVKASTPAWESIKAAAPPGAGNGDNNTTAIAIAPSNSAHIWVGTRDGRVFRTTAGTGAAATVRASWTTVDDNGGTNPLPNRRVTRITVHPTDPNTVFVSFGGFTGNNIYKTVNGGGTWADFTGSGATGLPDVPVRDVDFHPTTSTNRVYAATEIGIFASEDGGASWKVSPSHDGPSNVSVDELFFLNTDLYAVTHGRGIYRSATSTTLPPQVGAPQNLQVVSVIGNTVTLGWTLGVGQLAPTNHLLEGGINPGDVLASLPTGSAAPTFTFTAPTGAFYVRMKAMSGSNLSANSNEIRIYVNVPAPPSAPANLLGMVNGGFLALSWKNTAAGGAPAVIRLTVTGTLSVTLDLPGNAEFFIYPAVPGGSYTFTVTAINGSGTSAASNPVTLSFPGACSGAPQAPANFQATRSGNVITVTWDLPASGPALTSYTLNVSGSFVGAFATTGRAMFGAVGPGSYTLSVVASNPCGSGPATTPVTLAIP